MTSLKSAGARCREAVKQDVQRLAAMRWDFYVEDGERPAYERDVFERECAAIMAAGLAERRWQHFVAEIGDGIVAMASVQFIPLIPRPSRMHDRLGYLTNVYTNPPRRNVGIGQSLLEYIRQWARQQDLELLIVWPSDGSRDLYRRVGFRDDTEILELKLRSQ